MVERKRKRGQDRRVRFLQTIQQNKIIIDTLRQSAFLEKLDKLATLQSLILSTLINVAIKEYISVPESVGWR